MNNDEDKFFFLLNMSIFQNGLHGWKETFFSGEKNLSGEDDIALFEQALSKDDPSVFLLKNFEDVSNGRAYRIIFPFRLFPDTVLSVSVFLFEGKSLKEFLMYITPLISVFASFISCIAEERNDCGEPKQIGDRNQEEKTAKIGSIEENLRQWISSYEGNREGELYGFLITQMDKILLPLVLEMFDNNKTKVAKILGINRNTLRKKMTALGI